MPTVGVVESDQQHGYTRIAEPIGVLMGICPVTNPSSTIIFKVLIALKTRNCIILSPHPRAYASSVELCKLLKDAAQLTHHSDVSLILATGDKAMAKAASRSSASVPETPRWSFTSRRTFPLAVHNITVSKTFDNGMICASEQVLCGRNRPNEGCSEHVCGTRGVLSQGLWCN